MSLRSLLAAVALCLLPNLVTAQITPLTSGDVGDPEIPGKTLNNISFVIVFYNCQNEKQPILCRSYQFWASFNNLNPQPTLEQINRWNETKRFAQASTDGQGRYRLKMSVNAKAPMPTSISVPAWCGGIWR